MEAFARTGEAIRATSSKLEKTRLLGEYFAGLDDATLPLAAVYFAARPFADTRSETVPSEKSALRSRTTMSTKRNGYACGRVGAVKPAFSFR